VQLEYVVMWLMIIIQTVVHILIYVKQMDIFVLVRLMHVQLSQEAKNIAT
jgi:hypothetical protein